MSTWDLDLGALNVVCPGCGFTFAHVHMDDGTESPSYTCPLCGDKGTLTAAEQKIAEAWQPPRPADPVGAGEIAQRAGVVKATVWSWQRRHSDFPAPVQLEMGPVWDWAEIEAWLSRTNRTDKEA